MRVEPEPDGARPALLIDAHDLLVDARIGSVWAATWIGGRCAHDLPSVLSRRPRLRFPHGRSCVDVRRVSGGAAAAAGTWDEHATRYAGQERFEAPAVAAAVRLADPGPQDRVVDLATGTGLLLHALAAREPRPATATGVDRSAGMLAQVGRLPDDWRVIHGDARCFPAGRSGRGGHVLLPAAPLGPGGSGPCAA